MFLRDPHDEDREVARERRRVARGDGKNGILTLDNITKVYGYNSLCSRGVPDKIAVNQLCLIMKKAEVSTNVILYTYTVQCTVSRLHVRSFSILTNTPLCK